MTLHREPSPSNRLSDDELVRTLSTDGSVSVRAMVGTALVSDATARHAMAPTARTALGQALVGAVLLAVAGDERENIQLEFRGDGPLKAIVALSDRWGQARGYVGDRSADPPMRHGKLDVAAAIGLGLLTVARRRPAWKQTQTGTVALATSEIAKDLTDYLARSEQLPSAVGLGVSLSREGEVEAAGGFLVQALPSADDETLARVEANVKSIESTAELLRAGHGANDLIDRLLEGVGSSERHRELPRFHCPCSRDRALRTLALLGPAELAEMVAREDTQEVVCQFCGERYELAPVEVASVRVPH